jgi:phosphatidylserine/phosphatidylglycerophosphate/cardiolipin synthase-like enzyme
MEIFHSLSRPSLKALATALEDSRLRPPYEVVAVGRYVKDTAVGEVTAALAEMAADNTTPRHIANTLRLLAFERGRTQLQADKVELVWSGLETLGASSRDTRFVVREMFARAKRHLLLSSYVVDEGKKARALFEPLATAMDLHPDLRVQFYLNVKREYRDQRPDSVLLREFAERFRAKVWSGDRLPEVYHDPRSLVLGGRVKACLHAKCLVVDQYETLITSANYTEAAQDRNMEAGTLVRDAVLAGQLIFQFESLRERGHFQRVPGL